MHCDRPRKRDWITRRFVPAMLANLVRVHRFRGW